VRTVVHSPPTVTDRKLATPTIWKDDKLLTLINVFTVEPVKQQQLVALLIYARKLK